MSTKSPGEILDELCVMDVDELKKHLPQVIREVRSLSQEDRELLVQLSMNKSDPSITRRVSHQGILSVVMHAVGVSTIASTEEQAIRQQIKDELSKLNGSLEGYRSIGWKSPSSTV